MAEADIQHKPEAQSERGIRGVRGAIQIDCNEEEAIVAGAEELLQAMITANEICEEDVVSVFFSTTTDLTAAFPAKAARRLGWWQVALFGTQEQAVQGSLPRVIRILIHWWTARKLADVEHVYLGEATALRPDRVLINKEERT